MRRVLLALAVLALGLALAPDSGAAAPTHRQAILVGINDYAGGTDDVVTAVGDVTDLRDALLQAGWKPEEIVTLTDRQATAGAIRDNLRRLQSAATDSTFTVFHYSGHVKQRGGDPDRDGEELDEFLWGADNQLLADSELAGWARAMRGRAWFDIAGCEAAGFDDGLSAPNRLFTASSLEHEKSYEQPAWGNSVFTGLLVDQGMLQKRADGNGDGAVSIHEAFFMAADQAPKITANQSYGPQHPLLAGGGDDWWYLGAPPRPPAPTSGSDAPGDGAGRRRCLFVLSCKD